MAYPMIYYAGKVNRCPTCYGTSWYCGRVVAECATCHTAVPLAESHQQASRHTAVRSRKGPTARWREVA